MAKVSYLTTVDNPYDPADQFREWLGFDMRKGYGTLDLLGRIVVTGDALSPADQDIARELAIEEIVRENTLGIFKKVVKEE